MHPLAFTPSRWGVTEEAEEAEEIVKEKPNFGLTGALAKDSKTGNLSKGGTVFKYVSLILSA
jgi:hypothetical protein